MKIVNLRSLIFGLVVLSAGISYAAPSGDKKLGTNAEGLSKAMLPEAQFKQMVEAIVQTGIGAARSKIESEKLKIDMDKRGQELEKSLRDSFTYDYFISLNAKTMSKSFSEDELGKVLAFYNSPVGMKWTKGTPAIISDTMMQIQIDLQEQIPRFVEAMASK